MNDLRISGWVAEVYEDRYYQDKTRTVLVLEVFDPQARDPKPVALYAYGEKAKEAANALNVGQQVECRGNVQSRRGDKGWFNESVIFGIDAHQWE